MKALLSFYQKIVNQMHHKSDIIMRYCSKYKHLLDDYHHILRVHLNGARQENEAKFGLIVEELLPDGQKQRQCEFRNCNAFIRNNRNRDDPQNVVPHQKKVALYIDILDAIHVHFVHSYDAGFRFKPNGCALYGDENDDDDDKEEEEDEDVMVRAYTDRGLKALSDWVCDKNKYLESVRGPERMKLNKFSNDFRCYRGGNGLLGEEDLFPYSFGERCYYWSYYRFNEDTDCHGKRCCDWFIEHKYSDLKEELLSNKVFSLGPRQYEQALEAVQLFMASSLVRSGMKQESSFSMFRTKQRICDREGADSLFYGISSSDAIKKEHVLSIFLYSNYLELGSHLRATMRRLPHRNESDFQYKERNREYWHFAKLLRETVEVYGEWVCSSSSSKEKDRSFFIGLSSKVIFRRFGGNINAVISATTDLSVMALYQHRGHRGDRGFVLELTESTDSAIGLFVKYLNSSFFSLFAAENERIFVGGWAPLKFASILSLNHHQNFSSFLKAISVFNAAINGQRSKHKPSKTDYVIIDRLIQYELKNGNDDEKEKELFPVYPTEIFRLLIARQKRIRISHYNLLSHYPSYSTF